MTTKAAHRKATPKQDALKRMLAPILIVLLGLGIMLYPVIASTWNNYQQSKIAAQYETDIQEEKPDVLQQAIERAHEYNRTQTDGPILDPWLNRISEDNFEYQEYLDQLSGLEAMSQVVIPEIDVKLPLYHGTSEDVLQKGLGHLYGTALPVGGESTHSVITGHTGLTNATLFDNLDQLDVGSEIYISTFGEKLKYEVHDVEVVLPDETDSLATVHGEDLLTLITCTPYGINTHRILVHAHRVPLDDESVFEKSGFSLQWWMWVLIAVAIVVIVATARWIRNQLAAANPEKKETVVGDVDA